MSLGLGARGVGVSTAQQALVDRGYKLAVDGDYGGQTEAVVRDFQAHQHGELAVDGVIGPMTRARLFGTIIAPLAAEDPASNGLLIGGKVFSVPGHKVIGPHDAAWSHLAPGDSQPRRHNLDGTLLAPTMWVVHKTLADDPERLLDGAGPPGGARRTAEYWQGDGVYGGAHIVFGDDGEIACLADLLLVEAFHATSSNRYSVGSELRELFGGRFYRAALDANIAAIRVGCPKLGIQLQGDSRAYDGHPLKRMWAYDGKVDFGKTPGGPDMVGVYGHRSNTERRGKWDPGEILWRELRAAIPGFEWFDIDKGEDLAAWKDRQADLVRVGHAIAQIDGVPRADTVAALKLEGYIEGIWALGKAA